MMLRAMRTFAELRASGRLLDARDTELGAEYWVEGGGPRVRRFERVGPGALAGYVTLHRYAHLWIHRDHVHDAWHLIDVDEPLEVGIDFVTMPRRIGNAIESFERGEPPAEPPAELAEMRAVVGKVVAAATEPLDQLVAELVSRRVLGPDPNTILVWAERRFYVQDLAPTADELHTWRDAVARHGAASQWL
jgi:hypothetical protein